MIPSWCHCGSAWFAGSQATSSLKTTSPSTTAAALRSLAPRSKPIRQPSRCPPRLEAAARSAGKDARDAATTSSAEPKTVVAITLSSKRPVGASA